MPTYNYKAVTENGNIVKNKVEDINRRSLIKKLKRNNLTPISIVQTGNKINSKTKKKKRNVSDVSEMIAGSNIQEYLRMTEKKEPKSISKKLTANVSSKVTTRDLVIFTQDLYLLKKANFNNIHALSTIIGTTENDRLREIIKDILAGVEAGENMYTTM